ncbi:MAG: type II secretion system protein, partial [Acidobacteriota bacterium]
MKNVRGGFTLVEVLVSMILISFSSIFLMKCMITSLNSVKNSNIRFRVSTAVEIKKNYLISKNFKSPELSKGIKTESLEQIHLEIKVKDLTPVLKEL